MSGFLQSRRRAAAGVGAFCLLAALSTSPLAADLYTANGWSALASDRPAERVGDSLTVIINEASSASNSAQSGSKKNTNLNGAISAGASFNKSASLALGGAYDGSGQTGRTGSMVAEISVVVDGLLPNGDLHVSGERLLNINGDRENIKLKGRVRRSDITNGNTVLSTQLADASIDYNGTGFVSNGAKPGIVTKIFSWLGLL